MALVADCPQCASQLGLPAGVDADARVQCPMCQAEFSLAVNPPHPLPEARILDLEEASALDAGDDGRSPDEEETIIWKRKDAPVASPDDEAPVVPTLQFEGSYDDAYADADPELAAPATPQQLKPLTPDFEHPLPDVVAETEPSDEIPPDFEDEDEVVGALDMPAGEALAELRTTPRRRPKPAGLKTLVGIVGGGFMGILLGGYVLLWLRGPEADMFGLVRWLPDSMLPASARQVAGDAWGAPPAAEEQGPRDASAGDGAGEELADDDGWKAARTLADAPPPEASTAESATVAEPEQNVEAAAATENETPSTTDATPEPDSPPAAPIAEDLRNVALFSANDVAEALEAAKTAPQTFLSGDLSQRESFASMGSAYMQLCAVAEEFTLMDPKQRSAEFATQAAAFEELIRSLVADESRRDDIGTVASQWLRHEARPNQGIILVGRLHEIAPRGRWTEYNLEMESGGNAIETALLMEGTQLPADSEVAIAGAIVQNPREHVAGYDGDAAQVVVVGAAFDPNLSPTDGASGNKHTDR